MQSLKAEHRRKVLGAECEIVRYDDDRHWTKTYFRGIFIGSGIFLAPSHEMRQGFDGDNISRIFSISSNVINIPSASIHFCDASDRKKLTSVDRLDGIQFPRSHCDIDLDREKARLSVWSFSSPPRHTYLTVASQFDPKEPLWMVSSKLGLLFKSTPGGLLINNDGNTSLDPFAKFQFIKGAQKGMRGAPIVNAKGELVSVFICSIKKGFPVFNVPDKVFGPNPSVFIEALKRYANS